MCDLIDLHSSDTKELVDMKLASPLIPAPKNIECTDKTDMFLTQKRESLDNNPFDTVLHETTEYVCKKGDPFEMMLEKALTFKGKKTTRLRAQSVEFADDFSPKRKKRPVTLNKTLDESLIKDKLSLLFEKRDFTIKRQDKNVIPNKNTSEIICDNNAIENSSISKKNHKTFCRNEDSCNLSILNCSTMNDTLLEAVVKTEEFQEISTFRENDMLSKERIHFENVSFKLPNTSCSLSQKGRSPERLRCLKQRSRSVSDISRKSSQNGDNTPSSLLERGFLESKQSEQSIFSSLSNISSITILNSASLTGFDYNDKSTNFLKRKDSKDDRLIDVDIFIPKANYNKEHSNSSVSNTSTDSILTNSKLSNGVSKLILNEANVLAGMFEDLSLKADSAPAGMDDLISNNTLWMSELLPAYEDEIIVDNLIELPASPKENIKDGEYKTNKKQSSTSESINNGEGNFLKGLESQFIDCTSIEKQTIITLLLDLKKLVKTENNPEANKLLDNLESVLDVKWKDNTELLTTCLQITNDLQTSEKIDNNLDIIIEKSGKTSIERNEGENTKILFEENGHNSGNSLVQEIKDTLQITTINGADSSIQTLSSTSNSKDNSKDHLDMIHSEITSDCNHSKENNNYSDEKLAKELLINLGKLLSSQTEDTTILRLLKNIRKVLKFPSNNCEITNQLQADNKIDNIQPVTSKKFSESKYITNAPLLTKSVHKRNSDVKSESREKTSNNISSPRISNCKNKELFQLKEAKKCFSSDPGLISTSTNKKVTTNIRTNIQSETTVFDAKKEKSIPITEVKCKLKKKSDIVNKRGPVKAIHPVANMQKKVLFGKQTISLFQSTTSPKSNNIGSTSKNIGNISNMMDNNYMPKKIIKSKPVASSTPDDKNSRMSSAQLFYANDSKKCNSFDFSPITTHVNTNGINECKNSPKRSNKPPTPRQCTPKRQRDSSGIPKYVTPPRVKKHNSSFDMNQQFLSESPKCLNKSLTDYQRYSPNFSKKSTEKIQQSPLKDKNIITKAKPFNLISKFKRHSMSDYAEKENYYN